MRRIPLIPVAVAIIAGIAVAHFAVGISLVLWAVLLAVMGVATGVILLISNGKIQPLLFATLTLSFVALGALRCHMDDPRFDNSLWTTTVSASGDSGPSFMALRLKESPIPRERSWKALAEVEELDGQPCRGSLRLYLRKDSTAATLRYGDRLLLHGYPDRERGSLYATSDHYLLVSRDSTSLRSRSEALRMSLLRRMQAGPLELRYRGVAEAMTLGWRGDLESDLQVQFRDAGIMHLLCVSGLHVGLLAAIIGFLLFFIGKERRGRIFKGRIQLLLLWAFAVLTGLAPSTVRAALMFSLFIISYMFGRRTDTLNLLAAAAIAMLMVDPMLLFDTGWQLSFSAVAGILLARPAINLHRNLLWQGAIVSLAATLATLPVTLATFHQFQPYFLIANIIVVPAAGFLLAFSLLYMLLPCGITAFLARWPLWFCDRLTNGITHLPGAVVTVDSLSPWQLALIAACVIIIMITINAWLNRYRQKQETSY